MKRFASHYLFMPDVGFIKQQVVEITDEGVVRDTFPLTEEIESVEWMPGVIVLLPADQLEEIKNKAMHLKGKSIVKENESILTKECQEFIDKENGIVITDKKQIFDELSKNKINCKFYNRDLPLFKCYSLEKHLMSGINKKVWLNSGAYLIIEPTEALTVIDVNTGKAELKSNKEETFYKINIEAAHEVARQLKIRNISGIIIVDFISMRNKENEQILLNKMNEILKYDYSRCIAVDITKLGLMEITRKKGKKSLYEIIQK